MNNQIQIDVPQTRMSYLIFVQSIEIGLGIGYC